MTNSSATIVLVHGAWADGSSWSRVIPILQDKGFQVISVQIPLTSVEDDLAAANRIVADTKGPIVLVGHSWAAWPSLKRGLIRRWRRWFMSPPLRLMSGRPAAV